MLWLAVTAAWAEPWADPTWILAQQAARERGTDALLGTGAFGPLEAARLVADDPGDVLARQLATELDWLGQGSTVADPLSHVRLGGMASAGDLAPQYAAGDVEPGLLSLRGWADARLYAGPWLLVARPEVDLEVGPFAATLPVRDAWAGYEGSALSAGFGLRDRQIGPARHGGLLLTDSARPAPLGTLAVQGRPWDPLGRLRLEAGAGWLDGERGDVDHPGWLLMDARWLPIPQLELGATRMSLFGGAGRPLPPLGKLLLPLDPHVSDDPGQELPDQDELASLDVRATLPLGLWDAGPLRYAEAWWQYGGEDMIVRHLGPVPTPALAGVANLFGAEVAAGTVTLTWEQARVFDDYFRWYTGHRIYHEGFTRDGLSMGQHTGGDAMSWWGALSVFPADWGLRLSGERVLRIGVVEAEGDKLFALMADEQRDRLEISGWSAHDEGWWKLSAGVEKIHNADFVEGKDGWAWRVGVER